MTSSHDFDRVRAYVLGQLSEREAAEFERELAASPELAQFEREWRELQGPTRRIDVEWAESQVTFASLEGVIAAERASRWRRVAAVAAVAALAAGAGWWWTRSRVPHVVPLHAIELDSAPVSAEELPAALADYQPVFEGRIQWIESLDEGLRLARAAEKPLFLFGSHPTCPYCIHMKENALKSEDVLAMLDDFVVVQVDYSTKPIEEISDIFARGWPVLEVQTPDGTIAHRFPGVHEAPSFTANLATGLDAVPGAREAAKWSDLHVAARRYAGAREDETQHRFGAAYQAFVELNAAAPHGVAHFAELGLRRIAIAARDRLLAARSTAAASPTAVEEQLARAVQDFANTPFAADFERVLDVWRRERDFPAFTDARG